ncbi:MAG: hypothetical protein ACLT40_03415 [Fusobacterium sp.]
MMEESIFKSCLKRKVKFTASTFVKFLITGTVALSLTACGGGGGGDGSSSSGGNGGGNSSLEKPETHIKVEDKKFTTEENIDISSLNADSVIAILGTNSEIINNKKITVNDKESLVATYNSAEAETVLDAFKKSGNSFAIFADGGSVTNAKEGVLEISGNKVHAITGLYAEITNNGTITTGTNKADEAVGIFSLGGNVTNNGDIILTSEDATGINVVNGAKLYYTDNDFIEIKNKGKIIVLNNKNIKVTGESPVGISGVGSDIEVINGENGNIIVDNVITKTLKGINTKGISIDTDDGNSKSHDITITNNGKITVNVSSKIENLTDELKNRYFNSYGIYAEADTTTINNNKDIELNVTAGVLQQTSAGIKTDGKNNIINNSGNITIISKGKDAQENYFALVGIKAEGDNTTITNKNINITAENKCTEIYGISLEGNNGSVTNNGDITISGKDTYSIKGIDVNGNNKVSNNGNIEISGNNGIFVGIQTESGEVTNSGTITVNSDIKPDNYTEDIDFETYAKDYSYGIKTNGKVINEIGGEINISGTAIGMTGKDVTNNGTINITGIDAETDDGVKTPAGIFVSGKDSKATNNGNITGEKNFTVGMFAYDGATVINEKNGKITTARGFDGYNGHIINYGTVETTDHAAEIAGGTLTNYGTMSSTREEVIYIEEGGIATNETTGTININADYSAGFYADEEDDDIIKGSKGINKGTINVNGINSCGMYTYRSGTVKNYGVINVNGVGSYGMIAYQGGTAINERGATINVGANALAGMVADGGTTYNYGTINIDENNKITEKNDVITTPKNDVGLEDNVSFPVLKSAITVINGGKAYNYGEIYKGGNLVLSSDSTSAYIIGTNKDGSYGKVSAETVTVDGNVKVSAEMAKEGYKDSYALNNAIAGKTELGKNYKLSSTSLLYNAVSKTDEEGNLDVELVRNDTDISDLASKEISKVAGIFDSAMKDKTLSKEDKAVLDKVFDSTSSAKGIDRAVKEFTGYNVYSNIARQIFDTKDMFVSYDKSIIDSLGDYSFNFNFIGNYADVNSKNGTAGYDSKVTGINGAVRFTDSLYGVIGYGYNDIDYDGSSDGTIETIHTGIYKDIKSQFGDIRTGIFGEYNFHETDRKVSGEKADSDFNSYLVGANVEISRKFGDDLYIKPALSFDLSYGKYEDFKEDGGADVKFEKQDYVSAVPAIELKLGKEFETSEIYGAVKYSYELGDLNKEQEIELFEYREDFQADNIEDAQTDVKFGASFNIKNISVNAELGKEFGKRDREYVKAGFSYIF